MILEYIGFILAAFSVIGNDVIQTLGTFIQSNKKAPWWVLFVYIGGILSFILCLGWYVNNGDVSYGRLDNTLKPTITFWHLIPPILLLIITRFGIPVSTTFLILSIFSSNVLIGSMLVKSLMGYTIAFISSFLLYNFALYPFEKRKHDKSPKVKNKNLWIALQWISTAFLWSQWLIQDFANIYIFLPKEIDLLSLILSLSILLLILAYILKDKGGAIQEVVSNKTNSSNIRSATIVDFIYGGVLFIFTYYNNVPMSTTWAFIGILAGREIALRNKVFKKSMKDGIKIVVKDFTKVSIGIAISVLAVLALKYSELI